MTCSATTCYNACNTLPANVAKVTAGVTLLVLGTLTMLGMLGGGSAYQMITSKGRSQMLLGLLGGAQLVTGVALLALGITGCQHSKQ